MSIRLVPDVGAPLAVVAVDLITETYAPQANEWVSYILAGGSYIAASMGKGGDFIKNVGIASFPWAAKKIYDRARGGVSRSSRLAPKARTSVSRYPARATETQYQGIKLV